MDVFLTVVEACVMFVLRIAEAILGIALLILFEMARNRFQNFDNFKFTDDGDLPSVETRIHIVENRGPAIRNMFAMDDPMIFNARRLRRDLGRMWIEIEHRHRPFLLDKNYIGRRCRFC